MPSNTQGIKNIIIQAQTTYPIVSAYEFEFLKTEDVFRRLLSPCTIYIIIQRPLIYFDNLQIGNGTISFNISDGSSNPCLQCTFSPSENGLCINDEELLIDVLFFNGSHSSTAPFTNAAGFKLNSIDDVFIAWYSPTKFLYEYLCRNFIANVSGDFSHYVDYQVHYIGKAFSQEIWNRLTGHEKLQTILTLEESLGQLSERAPFEISLLMLDVIGYDEQNIFPFNSALAVGVEPILHNLDDQCQLTRFLTPSLPAKAIQLTNEVEALLVNKFRPKYNDILFDNYPNILSGTRSVGYTQSILAIDKMPAILRTPLYEAGLRLMCHG